jgi:ribosomal protein S7
MRKFVIHRNGTSAGELKQQQIAIMNAARTLETALRDSAPNMRDYYINAGGADHHKLDVEAMHADILAVRNIYHSAEDSALHAIKQGEAHGD